ncbi:MAG: RNA helicase, partial [Actinomycetales bacterium]
ALDEIAGDAVVGRRRGGSESGQDAQVGDLRVRLRQHPCHGCSDREQHARWAERYARTQREIRDLEQRVEKRTNSIARQFDRVCEVLADLDYLTSAQDDARVSDAGQTLMRLYTESDVLAAEVLRRGIWAGLDAPALAAAASTLVFESRAPEDGSAPRLPRGPFRSALDQMQEAWSQVRDVEERRGVPGSRELQAGFAWSTYRWASGATLRATLQDGDLTAGDFVRWTRQVIDLLGQVAEATAGESPIRAVALEAVDRLSRGVVSQPGAI